MHPLHSLHGPHSGSFFHNLPEVDLEIIRGRARSKMRRVESTVYLIGAAPDCDLVLGDPQFLDVHSYLLRTPEQVTIRRLGAGPELTVEGQIVESAALENGSRLRTGPYEFRVHIRWPQREPGDDVVTSRGMGGEHFDVEPALAIVGQLLADVRQTLFPRRPGLSVYLPSDRIPALQPLYPTLPPEDTFRRAV